MAASGNWLLVQRLLAIAVNKLLRLVFITVQRIHWQLNGTAQKLREARLPDNYERSAQVLDVLCYKFVHLQHTRVENFLCTHNRFENPQYIIDNDNITLMHINEHDAVFCETEEKGKHSCVLYWPSFIRQTYQTRSKRNKIYTSRGYQRHPYPRNKCTPTIRLY